jgi:hypothetical protein
MLTRVHFCLSWKGFRDRSCFSLLTCDGKSGPPCSKGQLCKSEAKWLDKMVSPRRCAEEGDATPGYSMDLLCPKPDCPSVAWLSFLLLPEKSCSGRSLLLTCLGLRAGGCFCRSLFVAGDIRFETKADLSWYYEQCHLFSSLFFFLCFFFFLGGTGVC